QIRSLTAAGDRAAAADAAWAAGDTLHVAAAALGSRVIRQAATAYDRAARAPYGRIPRPPPPPPRRGARWPPPPPAPPDAAPNPPNPQRHAARPPAPRHAAEQLHAAA